MFNKSNFCHIASNNRNEQKGSVFIYKTADTLAQVTQSGYFNEKLIDINLHDLIIHVQYDPVARTLKKSVLIVTERTMDNVETAPILDQTIGEFEALPDQTDNAGKFLTTDGTTASWSDKPLVNNSTNLYAVAVGRDAKATSTGATAFGVYTNSTGNYNIAFGFSAQATASAGYAIQLGKGTNADTNTFKVGNANGNFTMMSADGTIPADRISNLDFGTMD